MFCVKIVLLLPFLEFLQVWSNARNLANNCTLLENCPHINRLVDPEKHNYAVVALLKLHGCKHKKNRIYVECIDPSAVQDFMERASLIPNYDKCGLEVPKNKIEGGEKTDIDDHRWIALLKYRDDRTNKEIYACHASLISQRYLLTAAHCLYLNLTSVVLGEYNTSSETDCTSSGCVNKTELLVESFEKHPDYDPATFLNDIGLIRMERNVEYTDFITPICLPPIGLIAPFNTTLVTAGWGTTDTGERNAVKVQASFKLEKVEDCRKILSGATLITSQHYCAKSKNLSKTCIGDSGGPLMNRFKIEHFLLIGVTSLGTECGKLRFTKHRSIYTKVSPYVEWILKTIHP